jgi:hypothetical protein
MSTLIAVALYAVVLVAANLVIGVFGPMATGIVAFFRIGFDLTLRDWLQLLPLVVLMQFGAKLAGGALWSMVFNKVMHPSDV